MFGGRRHPLPPVALVRPRRPRNGSNLASGRPRRAMWAGFRALTGRRRLVLAIVVLASVAALLQATSSLAKRGNPLLALATPAPADSANGCARDQANDQTTICPRSPETRRYIAYVRSTASGVQIRLTAAGLALGRSCAGAARLVGMASDLYAQLPADQRSRPDLLWANPYITREVFGHSWGALFPLPAVRSRANPVDIVFADYESGAIGATWQSGIWRTVFDWIAAVAPADWSACGGRRSS